MQDFSRLHIMSLFDAGTKHWILHTGLSSPGDPLEAWQPSIFTRTWHDLENLEWIILSGTLQNKKITCTCTAFFRVVKNIFLPRTKGCKQPWSQENSVLVNLLGLQPAKNKHSLQYNISVGCSWWPC